MMNTYVDTGLINLVLWKLDVFSLVYHKSHHFMFFHEIHPLKLTHLDLFSSSRVLDVHAQLLVSEIQELRLDNQP